MGCCWCCCGRPVAGAVVGQVCPPRLSGPRTHSPKTRIPMSYPGHVTYSTNNGIANQANGVGKGRREEGGGREEGEGELFDKFFVAFAFPLKPGILALNQVVSLEASTWTQN